MRTFDVSKVNPGHEAQLVEVLAAHLAGDNESFNEDTMELWVNIADPQQAYDRAQAIMREATAGTDLYVEPEPIGFSV